MPISQTTESKVVHHLDYFPFRKGWERKGKGEGQIVVFKIRKEKM